MPQAPFRAKQLADDTFDDTQVAAKFAAGAFTLAVATSLFAAASIPLAKLEEAVIQADGGQAFTADQSMGSNKLTNLADGTAQTDGVNYGQLQAISAGLDPKGSARAATTQPLLNDSTTPSYSPTAGAAARGQITFTTGPTAIDGVTLANDDRILVWKEGAGTAEVHSVDTVADSAGSLNNTFFVFYATPNHAFYVWYNVSAGGSDPAPSAPAGVTYHGIEVAIVTNDTAADVATATKSAIDAFDFTNIGGSPTVAIGTNDLTITNAQGGLVTDVADGSAPTGFTIATDTQGTGLGQAANGIWVRTSQNTWDRATDFDTDAEVTAGAYLPVEEGTVWADRMFLLTTNNTITIGGAAGTPLTFNTFGNLNLGGTPTTIQPDDAAAEGVSTQAARSDHTHAIAAAAAVDAAIANAEGASTSFARADHTHRTPRPAAGAVAQTPNVTTGNDQDTGLTAPQDNFGGGLITVGINGADYVVGDGVKTENFYYTGDAGTTARALSAVVQGDALYYNGTITGFNLDASDKITQKYASLAG